METTFTIEQIKGMVGVTITRIQAKVTAVFDRHEGVHAQYGPWSLQNGFIEDQSGKMKVVFDKMVNQSKLSGKTLVFKSMKGKHGVNGLKVKTDKKTGEPILNITSSSLIVGVDEESSVTTVQDSPRGQAHMDDIEVDKKINKAVATVQDRVNHEDRKLGIATAKNRLTQLAGLYDLCWKTVTAMDCREDLTQTELVKDVATTLFIQAVREGLADKCPIRTTSKFYNEEAITPASSTHRGEPESFDAIVGEEPESEPPF